MSQGSGFRVQGSGFTLIEVLVTASLMALISLAILAVFAGGLNVYDRLRGYNDISADISLSLDKVEKDLRSTCNVTEIKFKGGPAIMTLPALVNGAPGSISYYVDSNNHYLVSEERDYSLATAEDPGKGIITNLAGADEIKFSYYYYDPKAEQYLWADTWESEPKEKTGTDASKLGAAQTSSDKKKARVNTPLGVKMEIRSGDKGKALALNRTVFFPLAVSLHRAELAEKKALAAKNVKQ